MKKKFCPHCGRQLRGYLRYTKTFPFGQSQRPRLSFRRTKWSCINKGCIFKKNNKVAYKEYSSVKEEVRDDRQ
jgi:hypothetical protein